MRFLLAENECMLVQHECKVVTLVQNTNNTRTLSNFVCFDFLRCFFLYIITKK